MTESRGVPFVSRIVTVVTPTTLNTVMDHLFFVKDRVLEVVTCEAIDLSLDSIHLSLSSCGSVLLIIYNMVKESVPRFVPSVLSVINLESGVLSIF